MRSIYLYFIFAFCLNFNQAYSQKNESKSTVRVIAFYSGNWDVAHIDFVKEANVWFDSVATSNNFTYSKTNKWNEMTDETLQKYDVVVFLDDVPKSRDQELALERFIKRGGGLLVFHAAAYNDKLNKWDWYYNDMLGMGRYAGNTWRATSAILRVENENHPIVNGIPKKFKAQPNEWYKWERDLTKNKDIDIILAIDESSFPLGTGPKEHEIWHEGYYPVVWANKLHNVIYINMGHNDMKYNPDVALSRTFGSEIQNKLILNTLAYLGIKKNSK